MKAIRGATTVSCDCAQEIRFAVKELLDEIVIKNNLKKEQFVCILFSNTLDIKSFYPAKAAREAGYADCALYSSLEPEIEGALEKCIRVMVLVETERQPIHVYLNGASTLRPDLTKKFNIALDGPAGSGKSTLAKILAKHFDILYLDTGAMYRACALECLNKGADINDEKQVSCAIADINLQIKYDNATQITMLNNKNVSEDIRKPHVSNLASKVSAYSAVRKKMVEMQRKIAEEISCVLDGRDIGTNVLPQAEYKFYVTASAEVRAKRRYEENKAKGFNQTYDEILAEIRERDERDKNREIAPLKRAEDAVLIDTSNLTVEDAVNYIKNKIQEKV